MPFSLGDAFVTIRPTLASGFERTLGASLAGAVASASRAIGDVGRELTQKLTLPIAVGTAANITQFQALDAKLRETETLFGAVGERADRLFDELRVGVSGVTDEIGIFEQTVSEGLYQAISAGVPKDNVFSFLETAGKAAVGGALDIKIAVDGLTTAVNAFYGADFTRASEAADILFRGVARGKTTFEELSQEMATAAPLAKQAGVSFEEFVAVLSTMTLSGTTTAEAVTQTRAAINGLLRPSEEMTAIFQEAGFASQDAAVQALGLQGALQLVSDAVGGSVGELIKLLGGAEAANAALQVTGQNAARFESILRDTSSAAGATNAAFRTMDEGAGRTFGRLFSQLDRLGSTFGEIAFTVIGPLTRGLTGLIGVFNDMADAVARSPVWLQQMIGGFVGLVAAMGPVLLIGSKLGTLFAVGLGAKIATGIKPFLTFTGLLRTMGGAMAFATGQTLRAIPALTGYGDQLVRVGRRGLEPATQAAQGFAGKIGGIALAITAGYAAYQFLEDWTARIATNAQFATDGTEKLADSLGLVVKPMQELSALPEDITVDFKIENAALLQSIGEAAQMGLLEDRLIQIGYRLVQQGNTPEEAFQAIQTIANAAGVELPITLTMADFEDTDAFVQSVINELRQNIAPELRDLSDELDFLEGAQLSLGGIGTTLAQAAFPQLAELEGQLTQISEQAARLFAEGETGAALDLLDEAAETLRDYPNLLNLVNDEFLKAVDNGQNLGFEIRGMTTSADVLRQLAENTNELNANFDQPEVIDEYADAFTRMGGEARLALEELPYLTEEMETALSEGMVELSDVIDEQVEKIVGRLTDIQDALAGQIPLWGEYKGAAELNVDEVIESLDAFSEDLLNWADTSEELFGRIPEALRQQLNELPLDQRAALARLADESPAEFDRLIDAYEGAFEDSRSAAEQLWQVELPGLVEEGNAAIAAKGAELEDEFAEIGGNVARAWRDRFAVVAAGWETTVATYVSQAVRAAKDGFRVESPSKVFQEIGEFVGQGFDIGLASTTPQVASTIEHLVKTSEAATPALEPRTTRSLVPTATNGAVTQSGSQTKEIHLHIGSVETNDFEGALNRFAGVMATTDLMGDMG